MDVDRLLSQLEELADTLDIDNGSPSRLTGDLAKGISLNIISMRTEAEEDRLRQALDAASDDCDAILRYRGVPSVAIHGWMPKSLRNSYPVPSADHVRLIVDRLRKLSGSAGQQNGVRLSAAEQDIDDVIREAGGAIESQAAIFDALAAKGKIPSEGTTKTLLAAMVRHGILQVGPGGKGYKLP